MLIVELHKPIILQVSCKGLDIFFLGVLKQKETFEEVLKNPFVINEQNANTQIWNFEMLYLLGICGKIVYISSNIRFEPSNQLFLQWNPWRSDPPHSSLTLHPKPVLYSAQMAAISFQIHHVLLLFTSGDADLSSTVSLSCKAHF